MRVELDGLPIGAVSVPVDDGRGAWVELASDEPLLLAALRRPGVHTLRITVPEGPQANGLCLYGAATGVEALPEGVGELPGRVEVRLTP